MRRRNLHWFFSHLADVLVIVLVLAVLVVLGGKL